MTGNKIAMIKATLKYTKQAEVIEAMKPLISSRGLFILTRTTRPVGSEVHFEFKLADNSITYAGEGIVRKEIPFVGGPSSQRSGMLVALRKVNRPFKEVVDAVIGAQQQSDRSITPSSMQAVPPEAIKPEDKAETASEAAPVAESAAVASSPVNSSIVDTKNSGESLDLFGDSDMEEGLDFLFSGIGKKPEAAPQMTKSSAFTQASLFGDAEGTDEFNFDDSIDMDDMDLNDVEANGFDESAAINEIAGEAEAVLKKCEDAHTTATAIHAGDDDATPVPDKSAASSDDEDVTANQTMTGLPCVSVGNVSSSDATPSKSIPAVRDEEEDVSEPTEQLSDSSIERVLHKAANIIETPETASHIDRTLQDADDAMASADESIAAANAVLAANAAAAEAEEAIAVAEAAVEAANSVATDAASTDAENEEARAVAETAIAAAQDAIVVAQDAVQTASDKDEALKENVAAEAAETEHIEVAESDSVADAETRVVSTEPEFKEVLSTPLVDVSANTAESPSEVFEALRGQFLEEGERLSQAQEAESPSEVFEALRDQFLEEGERLSNQAVAADDASGKPEGSPSSVFESLRAQILEESTRLNKEMSYESNASPLDEVIRDYSGSDSLNANEDNPPKETESQNGEEAENSEDSSSQNSKSGFKSAEAESLFSALQEDISKPVESASKSLIENLVNGTPVAPDTQRPNTVSRPRSQSSEQNPAVRVNKAVSSSENAKVEKKESEELDLSALVKNQESLILNAGKDSTSDSIDISKMPKRERKSLKSEVDESANQKKGFFGRLFGK